MPNADLHENIRIILEKSFHHMRINAGENKKIGFAITISKIQTVRLAI